jgi:hypothetical protein
MKKAKRNVRSYKISDKYYNRAQKKFAKTDKSLAERIEEFVIEIGIPEPKGNAINLPSDYITFSNIGVLRDDGKVDPLFNLNKKK